MTIPLYLPYLIQFVRGKRHDYLEKKIQMADAEELLEDIGQMEARIVIEELLENQTREQLLLQEAQGKYPEWNKMSDERLMKALHTLRDEEHIVVFAAPSLATILFIVTLNTLKIHEIT